MQTTWTINKRKFQIPAWSGRGFLHPPCPDGIAPVRLHYARKDAKAPLGVRGRFKRGCCVPPWIHEVFVEVDAGLRALVRFGRKLRAEDQTLYGTEGVNAGVSRALSAMRTSFDFEHLLVKAPSANHIDEFIHLAKMLRPYLRKTIGRRQMHGQK